LELCVCGILDSAVVQDLTKFPSSITKVLLQLGRYIINGVCYERYEKHLEQQKRYPNVNVCAVEEKL